MLVRTLGWSLLTVLLLAFGWHSATHSIDFPVYYQAAAQVLQGDYELYPRALYEGAAVPGHGFRYAPVLAFLFVPFALLPLEAAAFLLFCLKIATYVSIVSVIARRVNPPLPRTRLMLLTLLVTGGYVVEEFRNGNVHFLVVGLMVAAFDRAERGHVVVPASALAIAIAAKLLPAVLLVYFLLRRRFAVTAATMVALLVLWLLPAAVIGTEANNRLTSGFVRFALQKVDEGANHSLRGTLVRHLTFNADDDPRNPDANLANLTPTAVGRIALVLSVLGGAILLAALRRPPLSQEARWLELSLIVTAMLVGSPHTQRIYFSSLVVPVAVMAAVLSGRPRGTDATLARLALFLTAAVGTFLPLMLSTRRLAVTFEALSPHFVSALVLGASLLLLTAHSKHMASGRLTPAGRRPVASGPAGW